MMLQEFCTNLPKIELHAHLNGSLSKTTLDTLGCLPENISEYQKLSKLLSRTDKTLEECFDLFKVAHNATSTPANVYFATLDVIKEFEDDNVIYLELRTTPRAEENMTKIEYIQAVIDAIRVVESSRIIVSLILSINRADSDEVNKTTLDIIFEMADKYPEIIKGVDLCGNPCTGRFNANLFKSVREKGLKITLHCAETKNYDEVDQILRFHPDRIGHGTFIHPDFGGNEKIWHLFRKYSIPTECCLTSNVVCGTSKSYKEHHVKKWIETSLPFTLSTDDKGVFCTTLSKEYQYCAETFDLDLPKLWQISCNSIDYSFASDSEKIQLKSILEEWKEKHCS